MKKYMLALTISSSVWGSSVMAAGPNHITFQGEVTDQSCEVTINGNNTNPVVLLPTVAATELSASGVTAGETTFSLSISGCDGTAISTNTLFVGNSVDADGNMTNIASSAPAENVALQLLADGTPINLNNSTPVEGPSVIAGETEATKDYSVQYIATGGAATAGAVTGTVQFAITYL